jgi:hypothetical protein
VNLAGQQQAKSEEPSNGERRYREREEIFRSSVHLWIPLSTILCEMPQEQDEAAGNPHGSMLDFELDSDITVAL